MKTSNIYSGISVMFLLFMAFLSHERCLAQDQESMPMGHQDNGTFNPPHYSLKLPLFDTVRPTLCNIGKGLLYYAYILPEQQYKTYLFKQPGEDSPIMMKPRFTELELELLKQNLFLINEEYQIQIKEWIKKDKMDLNLGEAIRGFYMKPIDF